MLIELYGHLNACQWGMLSQYGGKSCLQWILSGPLQFGTQRRYGITEHSTQRIATQFSKRIEGIKLSEVSHVPIHDIIYIYIPGKQDKHLE